MQFKIDGSSYEVEDSPFAQVPLLATLALDPSALRLYCLLLTPYPGKLEDTSTRKLAERLDVSHVTVATGLKTLRETGWIHEGKVNKVKKHWAINAQFAAGELTLEQAKAKCKVYLTEGNTKMLSTLNSEEGNPPSDLTPSIIDRKEDIGASVVAPTKRVEIRQPKLTGNESDLPLTPLAVRILGVLGTITNVSRSSKMSTTNKAKLDDLIVLSWLDKTGKVVTAQTSLNILFDAAQNAGWLESQFDNALSVFKSKGTIDSIIARLNNHFKGDVFKVALAENVKLGYETGFSDAQLVAILEGK